MKPQPNDGRESAGNGVDPAALQELTRFAGLLVSNIALYGVSHPETRAVADRIYRKVTTVLQRLRKLEIEIEPACVRINGVPIPRRDPLTQAFATHLLARDIRSFSLTDGITEAQFAELVEVLARDEDQLQAGGGFGNALSAGTTTGNVGGIRPVAGHADLEASLPPRIQMFLGDNRNGLPGADYYTTRKRKFADFVLGMFGVHTIEVGIAILIATILHSLPNLAAMSCLLFVTGTLIGVPIVSFRKGRKFIAIGYLVGIGCVLLVPLLLVGACFLALSTGHSPF